MIQAGSRGRFIITTNEVYKKAITRLACDYVDNLFVVSSLCSNRNH